MPGAVLGLSHSENQNTFCSFPAHPTASLRISAIPKTPNSPYQEEQLHGLTVLSQPKDLDMSQIPGFCLFKDGTGILTARVEGQVKGHSALEVTCMGKEGIRKVKKVRNSSGGKGSRQKTGILS